MYNQGQDEDDLITAKVSGIGTRCSTRKVSTSHLNPPERRHCKQQCEGRYYQARIQFGTPSAKFAASSPSALRETVTYLRDLR